MFVGLRNAYILRNITPFTVLRPRSYCATSLPLTSGNGQDLTRSTNSTTRPVPHNTRAQTQHCSTGHFTVTCTHQLFLARVEGSPLASRTVKTNSSPLLCRTVGGSGSITKHQVLLICAWARRAKRPNPRLLSQ